MSLIVGPERLGGRDEGIVSVPTREAWRRSVEADANPGGTAPPRRPSAAITRRALRRGRLTFVAKRLFFRRGSGAETSAAASQLRSPWPTTREILAEIVLPLLGLAVVVGTALFWFQP